MSFPPAPTLHNRVRVRKYGGYGYDRFDDRTEGSVLAGCGSIGKVKVSCRFLFKRSKWGLLGDRDTPAGIIYLDIDFHQPPGSNLESASVAVKFSNPFDDGDSEHRRGMKKKNKKKRAGPNNCNARVTQYFGPLQLNGEPRHVVELSTMQIIPEANVAGFGAGGVGGTKERSKVMASRWKFCGQLVAGNSWAFQCLKWELTENKFDLEPDRSNTIHTAFAFEHDEEECIMTVEVAGKLRGWRGFKNKMKFGGDKDGVIGTLIHFPKKVNWTNPLDEDAKRLADSMRDENLHEVPFEVPSRRPAKLAEAKVTPPRGPNTNLKRGQEMSSGSGLLNTTLSKDSELVGSQHPRTIPLINLARAAGLASCDHPQTTPLERFSTIRDDSTSNFSEATTFVEGDDRETHNYPQKAPASQINPSATALSTTLLSIFTMLRLTSLIQLVTLVWFRDISSKTDSEPSRLAVSAPPQRSHDCEDSTDEIKGDVTGSRRRAPPSDERVAARRRGGLREPSLNRIADSTNVGA